MSKPLTRAQAEAALAAVKAQWASSIEPRDWSGHSHDPMPTFGLAEHLAAEHGYDEAAFARWAEKGIDLADKHAEAHKPEAMYPEPVLVEDWTDSGHWAIAWEEGPSDWAFRVSEGGPSEEDYVIAAQTSEEFGVKVTPTGPPAAKMPADVYAEPYYSFVLALYPA